VCPYSDNAGEVKMIPAIERANTVVIGDSGVVTATPAMILDRASAPTPRKRSGLNRA
jgi:hypothetical protein